MAQLQQAERGDEGQQRTIGQRSGVVHCGRFATEGQGNGLCRFRTGQMKGGVPEASHGQHKNDPVGQPYRHDGAGPVSQQLDGHAAYPVRQ